MKRRAESSGRLPCTLALMLALTGCGGGGGSSTAPPANDPGPIATDPPPPVAIQGVATPSTVSVVTATNAD